MTKLDKTRSTAQVFDFKTLVKKYENHVALKFGHDYYTYQQLFLLVKQKAKQLSCHKNMILSLSAPDPLNFIVSFLAIKQTKNYPFIPAFSDSAEPKQIELPVDTLFLGVTSGTTGQPKTYYRSWQSWAKGFDALENLFDFQESQIIATTSPLTTSLGLHTLILSLYFGKTFQLITHVEQLNLISSSSILFTVPTFLLKAVPSLKASQSLKTIFFGGGVLDPCAISSIKKALPHTVLIEFYGSSETSFISWQKVDNGKVLYAVGQPFPDTEVMISSNQEIMISSPYLFSGYLGYPTSGIWLTDDLGLLKENQLFLLGRQADIIDHGGNKISPYEIENAARDLCDSCVAFGVTDKTYGQKLALLLIQPLAKAEFLEKLQQRLPKFKLPQIYLHTDKLPLSITQKVSRSELEKAYKKGEYHEF